MARYDHLPIWKDAVALAVLLEEAVRRFPRYHKYTLGTDLRRQAYAVCRGVVVANGEREGRARAVERLAVAVEELKLLVQMGKEVKVVLSLAKHNATPHRIRHGPVLGGVALPIGQRNLRGSLPDRQFPFGRRMDAPIRWVDSARHEAREGGMRPTSGRGGEAMLDRVPMNVITMAGKIALVPQAVFPVAPLPDPPLPPFAGTRMLRRVRQAPSEAALDQIPAQGEIGIHLWKCPDAMQVVWQQHQGLDAERMIPHDPREGCPQPVHVRPIGEQRPPVEGDQREEKRGSGSAVAAITHSGSILRCASLGAAQSTFCGTPLHTGLHFAGWADEGSPTASRQIDHRILLGFARSAQPTPGEEQRRPVGCADAGSATLIKVLISHTASP